ncbi:MAG TPA: amidohydrolase family protein [Acidimicrobiia bacterium]|nr:amidohydrolase family protein [Acidimicrobiia bacterium]
MAVDERMMRHLAGAQNAESTRPTATFLPEPEPRPRNYTIISVDDHLIEPADVFEGRMPSHLQEQAPKVITLDDGRETWLYEDGFYPQVGLNAVAGRPKHEWSMEPARFDEMRRGCYDIEARVADMDTDGVYASLCFPSLIAGFAGTIFAKSKDQELGLAALRAWNDWHIEAWAGPHPDRIIPLQLAWVNDPLIAAKDIEENAARGFKAVSFPENPFDLKLPSIHDAHWDPFLRACEETETVICLHNGSSSWTAARSPGAPLELYTSLFPVNALVTAADWLWARVPTRFPNIKVAFSEGGISWVPMLIDRIEYVLSHSAVGSHGWDDPDIAPVDAMRRNFWFCTIDIGSTFALREHIGIDHICLESDYPHADSTWPDTQPNAIAGLHGVSDDDVRKVTWENASKLFRHPVPKELQQP